MSVPARGQDATTDERLDRVERDLNMLQRQVYRGAPPPPISGGGEAVNIEVRMERLESQMRDLTGRVEEVTNQVAQVQHRLEQINGDVDMRLGQSAPAAGPGPAPGGSQRPSAASLESRGSLPYPPPPGALDSGLAPPQPAPGSLTPPGAAYPPPGEAADEGSGGPTPIFGTLTPPGAGAPNRTPGASTGRSEMASTAPGGRQPALGTLPNGSATEQYNYAFGLLKRADYPAAEAALKSFLAQHPKDQLSGSAQYWLGETYYTRARYMEAAAAFAEGYKRYPKSPKAADDLLKLGMSLARANQSQNACLAFTQLDHDFAHSGASIKERAAAERKRLGC